MEETLSSAIEKTANYEAALRTMCDEYYDCLAEMVGVPNVTLTLALGDLITAYAEFQEISADAISDLTAQVVPELRATVSANATPALVGKDLFQGPEKHNRELGEAETGVVKQNDADLDDIVECIKYLYLTGGESKEASQDYVAVPAESDRNNTDVFLGPEKHNRELGEAETGVVKQIDADLDDIVECIKYLFLTGGESKEAAQDYVAVPVESDRDNTEEFLGPEKHNGELGEAETGVVEQNEDDLDDIVECIKYLFLTEGESKEAAQDNAAVTAESDRDNTDVFLGPEKHNGELSNESAVVVQIEAALEKMVLEGIQDLDLDLTGGVSKEATQDNVAVPAERDRDNTDVFLGSEKHNGKLSTERGVVVQNEAALEKMVQECIQLLDLTGGVSKEAAQDNVAVPAESDRDNTDVFLVPEKHNGELSTERDVVLQSEAALEKMVLEWIQDLDHTVDVSKEAAQDKVVVPAETDRDNTDVFLGPKKHNGELSTDRGVVVQNEVAFEKMVQECIQLLDLTGGVSKETAQDNLAVPVESDRDNTDVFLVPEKHNVELSTKRGVVVQNEDAFEKTVLECIQYLDLSGDESKEAEQCCWDNTDVFLGSEKHNEELLECIQDLDLTGAESREAAEDNLAVLTERDRDNTEVLLHGPEKHNAELSEAVKGIMKQIQAALEERVESIQDLYNMTHTSRARKRHLDLTVALDTQPWSKYERETK